MHHKRVLKHGDAGPAEPYPKGPRLGHTRGAKNVHWKGGRTVTGQGYVMVKLTPDDEFYCMVNSGDYVLEHRLVMARQLGRPLRRDENVHHINGDRADNRPENLELWLKPQPPGQRVEDVLRWAYELIERYGK